MAVMLFDDESETKYLYGFMSVGRAVFNTATGGLAKKNDGFWIIGVSGIYLVPKNLVPSIVFSASPSLTFDAILLCLSGREQYLFPDDTYDSPGLKYEKTVSVGNKDPFL